MREPLADHAGLDHSFHERGRRVQGAAVLGYEAGGAAQRRDEDIREARIVDLFLEDEMHVVDECLPRLGHSTVGRRLADVREPGHLLLEDGLDQIRPIGKAPVERRDADSCLAGDLIERCASAPAAEHRRSSEEDRLPIALGIDAERSG